MGLEDERRRLTSAQSELTFIGKYGTLVQTCRDPKVAGGELTVGVAITRDTATDVFEAASDLLIKHREAHLEAGTPDCGAKSDPISAIYHNRANRAVWIPLNQLTA